MWDGPCLAPQVLELERKWVELSGRKSVAPSVGKWWGKTDGKLAFPIKKVIFEVKVFIRVV